MRGAAATGGQLAAALDGAGAEDRGHQRGSRPVTTPVTTRLMRCKCSRRRRGIATVTISLRVVPLDVDTSRGGHPPLFLCFYRWRLALNPRFVVVTEVVTARRPDPMRRGPASLRGPTLRP